MTALAAGVNRASAHLLNHLAGLRVQLESNAQPYQGSFIGRAADGYAKPLVAGEPLVGLSPQTLDDDMLVASDGGQQHDIGAGFLLVELALTSVDQADVGQYVYLSDDNTLTKTAKENTMAGVIVAVPRSNVAQVLVIPDHFRQPGVGSRGVKTLAATGAQTLDHSHLDKVLLIGNTAALTLTLPPAADSAGRFITVKKTSADAEIVTLDGHASETIDGAANNQVIDAAQDTLTLFCDGVAWHVVASKIA